jgi:hypothetical protein
MDEYDQLGVIAMKVKRGEPVTREEDSVAEMHLERCKGCTRCPCMLKPTLERRTVDPRPARIMAVVG